MGISEQPTCDTPLGTIRPADLPAPPEAAIRIMRACSDDDLVGNAELSKLAASDPLLTAELLRVVNSAWFGFPGKIKSIAHAMSILGRRALRNLALCIAVRDALSKQSIEGLDIVEFWEDALRRGASAHLLGKLTDRDPEECFTAGLLQDFGLLVLFSVFPDQARHWTEIRGLDPDKRLRAEQGVFGTTHEQVVHMLACKWELPDELAQALGTHHRWGGETGVSVPVPVDRILYCGDWLSSVFMADDAAAVLDRCRRVMSGQLGLQGDQINASLDALPGHVEDAAVGLGLRVNKQVDFDQVIRKANLRLAEDNLGFQELTWRLEATLRERDRLAGELDEELQLAREIQRALLPSIPHDGFPVNGVNVPARRLSGDFYDYFELDDGLICFCLGDVSGKGINAGLLMAKTGALFRYLAKQKHEPGRLLQEINLEICETAVRGMFVTMVAGLYDRGTGIVRIANAGHEPVLHVGRTGKAVRYEAQAPPLGIVSDCDFPEQALKLDGGSLYLYTDGVTEGRIAEDEILGARGLFDAIRDRRDLPPRKRLETIAEMFTHSIDALRDDVTLLLIEDPCAPGAAVSRSGTLRETTGDLACRVEIREVK
jgi:serine phosphatase RsbU (regulator of sigma subunit)/HD-like signal output (HDOD) protein